MHNIWAKAFDVFRVFQMHHICGWLVAARYIGNFQILSGVNRGPIIVYYKVLITRLPVDKLEGCIRIFLRLTETSASFGWFTTLPFTIWVLLSIVIEVLVIGASMRTWWPKSHRGLPTMSRRVQSAMFLISIPHLAHGLNCVDKCLRCVLRGIPSEGLFRTDRVGSCGRWVMDWGVLRASVSVCVALKRRWGTLLALKGQTVPH